MHRLGQAACRWPVAAWMWAVLAGPAQGATDDTSLITALSEDEIQIESNFSGARIVVFGQISRAGADERRAGRPGDDIVVTVSGPPQSVVARRKEQVAGLWINREEIRFDNVPAFYAIHSTRPMADIAQSGLLSRNSIGIAEYGFKIDRRSDVPLYEWHDFRAAVVRLRAQAALFDEQIDAIEFLNDDLFRTRFVLPANAPVGVYMISGYVFRGGKIVAASTAQLTVHKSGFGQFVYEFARNHSWLYGLTAVLLAICTGWLAGIIFRRD